MRIIAKDGFEFIRKHDQFTMGNEIWLGYDYSTGIKRLDLEEYYEQVEIKKNEEIDEN